MPLHILNSGDAPQQHHVRIESGQSRVVEVQEPAGPRPEVRIEQIATRVVEVALPDPVIVRVIEPLVLDTEQLGRTLHVDDLVDVEAPADTVGLLERQDDGLVRPVTRDAVLAPHINAPTPHPAYDDTLDLTLIFNNGLV